jgi:hypothetical protein
MVTLLIGGCAGGSSCSGVAPLPEGFKAESRIENAGSVRLTSSGVDFLEKNLGTVAQTLLGAMGEGGVITFQVPKTSGSQIGIDYDICKDGPKPNGTPPECVAELDLGSAVISVDPKAPRNISISGDLPLRLQDLPIDISYFGIPDDAELVLNGNKACPPSAQTFAPITVSVDISIEIDANEAHSRHGYSRVKIGALNVDKADLEKAITFCGGSFSASVLNFIKGFVVDLLFDQLIGTLGDTLEEQLCQQANPELNPPCPKGTNDVEGICRYGTKADAECASIILGLDGNADLGSLLAGISPGTKGGLDFLFAAGGQSKRDDNSGYAWGDLNPIGGGATLGLYGGVEPMPVSGCVPFSNIALPTGIPIPNELLENSVPDWPAEIPGPHVGIAVSERFANYALSGMYNSGMLCIGISTSTVDLLSSGTLGLIANSLKDLGLQQETQQIAITVRPQAPPQVVFGNGTNLDSDPLVRVTMKQASFDFYIWSLDRFIRFMTVTFDVDVPLNLTVTPEGIQPVLNKIGVSNGVVTNSALLREDPGTLAATLQDLIGGIVGQAVGGGIPPIDLNSSLASLGLSLNIPESVDGKGSPGLRKLTKDTDSYLGIFAGLGFQMMPGAKSSVIAPEAPQVSDSSVQVVRKEVDPAGVRLPTMTPENAPRVRVHMASVLDDGSRAMEYAYRVDNGFWHPYTAERIIDLDDPWLRVQGRHVVQVRSRVAGDARSLDPTPATVEVLIDVDAPAIKVGRAEDGKASLSIKDFVSGSGDQVSVRTRLDSGAWSEWKKASEVTAVDVGEANDISVEARDEEGNVATATQAIIRGGAAPSVGGCGCVVAGADEAPGRMPWALGAALAAIALRLAKKRGRGRGAASSASPALSKDVAAPSSGAAPSTRRSAGGLVKSAARGLGSLTALALITSWAGCSCGEDAQVNAYTCAEPDCQSLRPGLIGAYTSAAVSKGTIWVAGYVEGDWDNAFSWGDLAVGTWSGDHVAWTVIDGVPSDNPVDPVHYNQGGFRGGQTDAGPDVGLWTSVAIDARGNPMVAYYDRTNRGLKLAQYDGKSWRVITVQQKANADLGKYAKLLVKDGKPVIAYLAVEPGGESGALQSGVRLATASSESPGEADFTFEDVVVDKQTPCREYFCGTGSKCVASTGRCTETSSACPDKCKSGTACIEEGGAASCVDILDGNVLDAYPAVVGAYVALAQSPSGDLGIAYYDRLRGNLAIARQAGGAWTTTVLDGEAGGTDNGDKGIGATLAIDGAGDWHLAYADGYDEALRYVRVAQGTTPSAPEIVDDGLGIEGDKFSDGQHIVGDDANIFVTPSGEVHISYQDATAGTLRHAVGSPSANGHSWLLKEIEQGDRFGGAFSRLIEVEGKLMIANWWRVGGQNELGTVGDVAIVSP